MVRLIAALILGALILEPAFAAPQDTTPFSDFHEDSVPSGWSGPVFKLSQDYPTTKPAAGTLPWKSIDFKTKPADYLKAVLNYCYEGNIDVDWAGQDNAVRKWYHAPWLHYGNKGREFIHGMTRERTTPARRLHLHDRACVEGSQQSRCEQGALPGGDGCLQAAVHTSHGGPGAILEWHR